MNKIKFTVPQNIENASEMLDGKDARVLAGGTDLLGVMRERILPDPIRTVVSLNEIEELKGIKNEEGFLSIGSMMTLAEISDNKEIRDKYPLLAEAAKSVASPQIRNVATIGGNICQEPRCWYYRYQDNKYDCLRKGGFRCNAMVGRNMYHSIFGAVKSGETPCASGCPNSTDIPLYLELIREGKTKEAADILFSVNPIAATTGRVCPHDCESDCNRGYFDENINVREIERYLGDFILENASDYYKVGDETGKRISIIGAGPAGMTAAIYLRMDGHAVTVYDENEKTGGMLYYGIPSYRLPKDILDKYRAVMEGMGISFRMNTKIGKDISLEEIREKSDAVFVGIGAWKAQEIGCAGEDAVNVFSGIDFLYKVAKKKDVGIGEKVVVVGGGNTAMDAARTAKRMGARDVTIVYRRSKHEMPAEKDEISEAEKEGIIIKTLVAPVEIITNDNKSHAMKLQKMKLGEPDESGRCKPIPIADSYETIETDSIIVAIGQYVEANGLDGINITARGNVATEENGITNVDNIYSSGDCVSGAATAVEAIAGGRSVARSISRFPGEDTGETDIEESNIDNSLLAGFDQNSIENIQRTTKPEKDIDLRTLYEEDEETLRIDDILGEAKRCFNCGCVASSPTDIGAAVMALDGVIVTDKREIPAERFFRAGITSSTVLMQNEIVKFIKLPPGRPSGNCQSYFKYRTREAIDFPILSLAVNLEVSSSGKITGANVIAGAAAPVPIHLVEAERLLLGQNIENLNSEDVSVAAVGNCINLAENRYKINLLKVHLRRLLDTFISD